METKRDPIKKKATNRRYYLKHKEHAKEYTRLNRHKYEEYEKTEKRMRSRDKHYKNFHKRTKDAVFNHYGLICACCGESTKEFMSIDHINGGGNQHRKSIGGGTNIYRWLVKNNFPEGFRTLCFNCNLSMGFYGYCPHKL